MDSDEFYVITAYFNPAGYKRRAANFRRFREKLNALLIVAEMSKTGTFEVPPDDRTVVIRITSSDVMWQKESLLNVALDHVPRTAKFVAWLDCDVLFERQDWQDVAKAMLVQTPLVQLFTDLHDLPVSGALNPLPSQTGTSIVSLYAGGRQPGTAFRPTETIHMRQSAFGLAWAARIEVMRQHRFYDAMIIGSGDRALACAALGHQEDAVASLRLSPPRAAHYEAWARPFYKSVRGHVGFLPGRIFHLWHGDIADRGYTERHARLADLSFDPTEDLIRTETGLWQWRRERADPLRVDRVVLRIPARGRQGTPMNSRSAFSSVAWFDEAAFPAGYHSVLAHRDRVGRGRLRMARSRAIICGLGRDLGAGIHNMILWIERLGASFLDYRVIVVENSSFDHTRQNLESWAIRNRRVILVVGDARSRRYGPTRDRARTEMLAALRESYRAVVSAHFSKMEFAIVLDMDLGAGWSPDGIADTFGYSNWDAVASNGLIYVRAKYKSEVTNAWRQVYYDSGLFARAGMRRLISTLR